MLLGLPFVGTVPGPGGSATGLFLYEDQSWQGVPKVSSTPASFRSLTEGLPFYGLNEVRIDDAITIERLQELNVNTVSAGPIWRDLADVAVPLARLRAGGVKIIVEVNPGTFEPSRASSLFADAKNRGVERSADMILIGGDNVADATQEQRRAIYLLAKDYFPNTPILRRYDESTLQKAESLGDAAHPILGRWYEYRFGPNECDVAVVSFRRHASPVSLMDRVMQTVSVIKTRHVDAGIIIATDVGPKGSAWSATDLGTFVSSVLSGPSIDGLLVSGLSDGLEAHRTAFKLAAPVISQTLPNRAPAGL